MLVCHLAMLHLHQVTNHNMKKIFLSIISFVLVATGLSFALPVSAAGPLDCSRPKDYIDAPSVVVEPSSPNAIETFRVSANFSFKSEFRRCIEGAGPIAPTAYFFQFVYENYGGKKESQSILSRVSGLTLSAGDLKSWPQLIDGIWPTGSVVRLVVGLYTINDQGLPNDDGAVVKTQNITFQGVTIGGGDGGSGQGGISPSTLTGAFKVGTPFAGQTFSLTSPPAGRPTVTWSKSGNLPPGLVLTQLSGSRYHLSGTPTVSGNYTFTLIAQDATSTTFAVVLGSQTYNVAVADKDGNPPPPGGGGGDANDTGNGNGTGNGNDPAGTGATGLFFNNPLEASNLPEFFIKIMNILLLLIGMLSVVMIIFGGFVMITSGGAPAQITKGKSIVTWAVAGLVVALLAFSIISIVQNLIGTK